MLVWRGLRGGTKREVAYLHHLMCYAMFACRNMRKASQAKTTVEITN